MVVLYLKREGMLYSIEQHRTNHSCVYLTVQLIILRHEGGQVVEIESV